MFVKSISVLLVLVLSSFIHVSGQVEILEKSYKIAKKDRKGALIEVATNEETKILSMVYARSSGLNKIKFDAYKYDVDLNFLGVEEEVDKLKWGISFGFDKEEWTTTKFLDRFGPTGQVTFIKKVVDHKWNIVTGHSKKVVSSEKIKPKNDVGDKYFHKGSYVVEEDNSILVFTGIHIKKTLNQMQDFHIMHCDGEMNITLPDSYKSKYLMNKVYDGIIVDDNISVSNDEKARDWTVVLAPLKGSGPYEASTNPNLNLYRYLRISPKGKILENIEFESPCNGWRIDGVYEKNGSVYFYGQGLMKDVGKTDWAGAMHIKGAHAGSYDTHEYTHFQYVKFTGGKLEFSSAVSAADIDAKKIKPAGQSDFITYDAEQFKTLNFMVTGKSVV